MISKHFALNDTDVSVLLRAAVERRKAVLPALVYSIHQLVKLSITIFDMDAQK